MHRRIIAGNWTGSGSDPLNEGEQELHTHHRQGTGRGFASRAQAHPHAQGGGQAGEAAKPVEKPEPQKPVEQPVAKHRYAATARCGKTNTRASATPLSHAVDVKISDCKGPQFAQGVIVGFSASKETAESAADAINAGGVATWSEAVVVPASLVKEA